MDLCEKLNMKYNACVFLSESAKGTSEVTQNAQFILRGLMENSAAKRQVTSDKFTSYLFTWRFFSDRGW